MYIQNERFGRNVLYVYIYVSYTNNMFFLKMYINCTTHRIPDFLPPTDATVIALISLLYCRYTKANK